MVQVGGRLRFVLEALELLRVQRRGEGQHLQGHPPAQRELHRLVDDAHAAAADLADDAEVAQRPLRLDCRRGRGRLPPACLDSN